MMKVIIVFSAFLIFQFSNHLTLAAVFQIRRTRQSGVDSFAIPSSLCPQNSEYDCSAFNAETVAESCNCSCPLKKATFKLFENQWACHENNDVRTNLQSQQYSRPGEKGCPKGMETMFTNEFTNSSLHVLNVGDEKAISILSTWTRCELDSKYSWYSGCGDSRLTLTRQLDAMNNLFKLEKGEHNYILKVGSNVSDTQLLRARIINLGIYCTNADATQTRHGCLLFKMEGSITCDVTKTSKVSPKTLSTSPKTVSSTPTTSSRTNLHLEAGSIQPSLSSSLAPSPTSTVTQQNVSFHVPSSRPHPDDRERSTGDNSQPMSLWIITSATVSTLFIIIIVGCLVFRRSRHSKKPSHMVTVERSRETQTPEIINSQTNSAFQEDDEYDGYFALSFREPSIYTSTYQVPVVDRRTSLNEMTNPLGQHPDKGHMHDVDPINGPLGHNFQSFKNTTQAPVSLKGLIRDDATRFLQNYGPLSIEQLVYNIVEEILAGDHEKTVNEGLNENEPVYQVIEEPYRETSQGSNQYDDVRETNKDPVYSTLEETVNAVEKPQC